MKRNETYQCIAYKSLPHILFSSKSNKIFQLHTSKSLPSCFKFLQEKLSISTIININKKKSNPTIGELLGDDDLFHHNYHNQYSSLKSKRKRHYHRSYSRSSSSIHVHYNRRKQRRNPIEESQPIESIPNTNQIYLYPTSTYCYYCQSNITSCYPYLISDCYGRLYQQEICYET